MNTAVKALIALFLTIIFFSLVPVIARSIVASVLPFEILFLRLLIASMMFFPFLLKRKPWRKPHFSKLILISLASTVNVVFFIVGIQYTTASASQIIYAVQPILILFGGVLFFRKKHTIYQIAGIGLGLGGILLLVLLSILEKGQTISGSFTGNLLMVVGMLGWLTYSLLSKKISRYFSLLEIASVSVIVSFLISVLLFTWEAFSYHHVVLSLPVFASGAYMGIFGTFATYLLLQYAIRHLSVLTVSLSSYIQPVMTTTLAILFIGEQLTGSFILGSVMILGGVFFTMYHDFARYKKLPELLKP